MPEDQIRISAFKKVLRQYANEGVVDLDKNYKYKFDFQIHRYEDVLRNSRMASPPHRWSYYRICFLKQGEGDLVTGIYKFKARENAFFVIPSRVIVSSENWTTDTEGFVLLFNLDFFLQNNISHQMLANKKWLTGSVRPDIYLAADHAEEVGRIMEAILAEKKQKDKANTEFIAVKILELLIMGERLSGHMQTSSANGAVSDIVKQFVDLLDMLRRLLQRSTKQRWLLGRLGQLSMGLQSANLPGFPEGKTGTILWCAGPTITRTAPSLVRSRLRSGHQAPLNSRILVLRVQWRGPTFISNPGNRGGTPSGETGKRKARKKP